MLLYYETYRSNFICCGNFKSIYTLQWIISSVITDNATVNLYIINQITKLITLIEFASIVSITYVLMLRCYYDYVWKQNLL